MIVIVPYYNPCKFKTKNKNYHEFRKKMETNKIEIITVELADKEENFEIKDSIKFFGNAFLSEQKERLISKVLNKFSKINKFAWLDCDIVFENINWYKEAVEKLEKYDVLQLFSEAFFLNINKKFKSFFFEFYNNANFSKGYPNQGHPGLAFAARREYINFYCEKFIFSNDVTYVSSIAKNYWIINNWKIKDQIKKDIISWCSRTNNNAKFYYLDGKINHLWHGSWKQRRYESRMDLVNKFQNKIFLKNEIFECEDKDANENFKNYTKNRNEDGIKIL